MKYYSIYLFFLVTLLNLSCRTQSITKHYLSSLDDIMTHEELSVKGFFLAKDIEGHTFIRSHNNDIYLPPSTWNITDNNKGIIVYNDEIHTGWFDSINVHTRLMMMSADIEGYRFIEGVIENRFVVQSFETGMYGYIDVTQPPSGKKRRIWPGYYHQHIVPMEYVSYTVSGNKKKLRFQDKDKRLLVIKSDENQTF